MRAYVVGIISPNLNVPRSFNYQKLILLKPNRACLFFYI